MTSIRAIFRLDQELVETAAPPRCQYSGRRTAWHRGLSARGSGSKGPRNVPTVPRITCRTLGDRGVLGRPVTRGEVCPAPSGERNSQCYLDSTGSDAAPRVRLRTVAARQVLIDGYNVIGADPVLARLRDQSSGGRENRAGECGIGVAAISRRCRDGRLSRRPRRHDIPVQPARRTRHDYVLEHRPDRR